MILISNWGPGGPASGVSVVQSENTGKHNSLFDLSTIALGKGASRLNEALFLDLVIVCTNRGLVCVMGSKGIGLGGFQSCPFLSCSQPFWGSWYRFLMSRALVLQSGIAFQEDIVFTGLCLLKKKILILNHFQFLLLMLNQNSTFQFSVESQPTQQTKAKKQSCAGEAADKVLTLALGSNARLLPSQGLFFAQLQGALVTHYKKRASPPHLYLPPAPNCLLVATKAPPVDSWKTIDWPKRLQLSFANGTLFTYWNTSFLWGFWDRTRVCSQYKNTLPGQIPGKPQSLLVNQVGSLLEKQGRHFFLLKPSPPN